MINRPFTCRGQAGVGVQGRRVEKPDSKDLGNLKREEGSRGEQSETHQNSQEVELSPAEGAASAIQVHLAKEAKQGVKDKLWLALILRPQPVLPKEMDFYFFFSKNTLIPENDLLEAVGR